MQLEPGTVLAGKYKLGSVLGVGGMGTVYVAEHLALKAPVAIKVIDREVVEGDVALARFMREAQAAASLRSPHVVQILDYGMEGKRPFMVMEMLEGEALSSRIKSLGQLSPQETFRVVSHVARAISKAHEADIVHRDLKPDNIFLVHNEGDEVAKVLDFGVAKVDTTSLDGAGHTRTGSLLGTPYYMSPEQAQGNKDVDSRSDLWALGVIAFECLTGKRPFSSDGLGDLVLQICIRDIPKPSDYAKVPDGFDAWFEKACTREVDDRFQTARSLAEALKFALHLNQEAPGSIPESRWSQAASVPGPALAPELSPISKAEEEGELSQKTTQPDSSAPTSVSEDLASTRVSESEQLDTSKTEKAPSRERQGSQWEVLPHGHGRELPQKSSAQFAQEEDDLRPSSKGTVLFVAFFALLVGGAIVFGIKQAGVDFSLETPETTQPTEKKKLKAAAPTKKGNSAKAKKGKTGTSPKKGKLKNKTGAATPSNDDPIPSEAANTDTSLDAIDNDAESALKERKSEELEDASAPKNGDDLPGSDQKPESPDAQTTPDAESVTAENPKSENETEEPPSRPEPTLPDNLAPVPEPPKASPPAQ